MVIRLHLTLWRRMVRANPAVLLMMFFVGFYGLIGLASSGFFLYTGAHGGPHSYIACVIAAGVLGYITLMALMPSGEQQVSARDFATLPVRPEQVRAGLLGVTFLQSRPVVALLCTVITGVILCVAAPSATTAIVALPLLVVSLCTTVLAGDVIARAVGRGSSGSKDRKAVLSGLAFLLVILAFNLFVNYGEGIPLDALGAILAWTPLGATGGVIGAVLGGQWGVAAAQAAIALATLVILGWLWLRGVRTDMEEPQMHGAAATRKQKVRKDGDSFPSILLPGLPYTPAAAIFSRAVRYLRRDSRMLVSFIPPAVPVRDLPVPGRQLRLLRGVLRAVRDGDHGLRDVLQRLRLRRPRRLAAPDQRGQPAHPGAGPPRRLRGAPGALRAPLRRAGAPALSGPLDRPAGDRSGAGIPHLGRRGGPHVHRL
ncbi:hypothetical protein ACUY2L_08340 [Corynebacterium mastitidis]